MTRLNASLLMSVLLVGTSVFSVGAIAGSQQADGYAGTHVEFETANNAIVDYTVNGETVLQSVSVQSQSNARSRGDVRAGVGLSAVTQLTGAALSLDSTTDVSATVTAESGAQLQAHDNSRGILVIRSGGASQYVTVNLSSSSQADRESDRRVVVTTEDGTKGTFIVVGDGEVTVNEQGNVTAKLENNGTLVFRSYPEGRDDEDKQQEQLISEGKAAAEVYVIQKSEQGSDLTADIVQYSEDTTVEVTQTSNGTVTMTAERAQEQGTIIVTTVSEQAISSVEDLQVTVDGEAAAKASSYSDLESAINDGDTSKFLVRQQTSAEANADILVAMNHFSTREITMSEQSSDAQTESNGEETTTTSTSLPGFTMGVALATLLALVLFAYWRA